MTTQIGLGIQPGTYTLDIIEGTFSSYNTSNSNGSFTLVGTWDGGYGAGTFEINGTWIKSNDIKPESITSSLQIYDNITTSWTTNSTTLRDTSVNLVSNGGIGQVTNSVAPIKISITSKVPAGTSPQWKVTFVKDAWYTYDRSNSSIKYFFDETSSSYNVSNYYVLNSSTAGTFFNIGGGNYYSTFGGTTGTIVGQDINVIATGAIESGKIPSVITKSKSTTTSSTSISPTAFVEPIPVVAATPTETTLQTYYVPNSKHIGRNILPCETVVELVEELSTEDDKVYRIVCAPPGLFAEENYVIVPSSSPDNAWKYFYHLVSDTDSVEPASDGSYVVNNIKAEFPTTSEPTDADHWIVGDLNASFQFDLDFPLSTYQIYRNIYSPRESKMFAWAGKKHFGIIVGDPNSTDIKRFLIY